ncbi:ComEC/Rec2 family competence protein [Hyphomicrobium sp.]|uniref:ComEC/Rec2 family competence protein n=1 Tax=Hyphomicrobium sp. TaxID=82 RepID=UPI002E35FD38|nr:ComEC/Rec2 family competence protein [Hyphomicrobium sp.]HEX2843014.1 ComEC/Rec2 family competence protein [Hyphomicrobium sp.]
MEQLERERARWFVWLPVAFGAGIAGYFSRSSEPSLLMAIALPAMASGLAAASRRAGFFFVLSLTLLTASLGFAVAKVRTEWTRAPVLTHELRRADVTGVVELIEPRPERGERLTLRVTDIRGLPASERPERIRVRVMVKREGLQPGDTVRLRASLRPPSMPALPGGYDFARTAWFQGLGATGYAIHAAEIVAQADAPGTLMRTARERIETLRQEIAERVRSAVPGETGAIAVSLITGERGAITEETNDAYRDSGIVHILSISGLHMVIMAGAVFLSVRVLLAAFPAIALRYATKKWAAAAALLAAGGYLLISGGSIPTIRAFLMIAIMLVAVMFDRQALAMRNVAISALLVLVVMPESLLDPGFQMSFAAVVSLIAAYETVRKRAEEQEHDGWFRRVAFFLGGIVLSTVIASCAVAPIGAYHFHRSQQYALLANLIAVPICNLIVMPAALFTLVLMPFGFEALPLAVMALGIDVMSDTARWVAALPGAVIHIPDISDVSFALMIAGGLWLTIWQTQWRALGLVAIGLGVLVAGGGERPDILVGRGGEMVAVRGPDGRLAATGSRSGNFELTRWLQHDGDGRAPRDVIRARVFRCDGVGCTAQVQGLRVAVARHPAAVTEDCKKADLLIAQPRLPFSCVAPLAVINRGAIRRDGTHAIYLSKEAGEERARVARIDTVASRRGDRPWTQRYDRAQRWSQGSAYSEAVRTTGRPDDDQ